MAGMKNRLVSVAKRVGRAMGFMSKRERAERLAAENEERDQHPGSDALGHTAEENERAGHRYLRP